MVRGFITYIYSDKTRTEICGKLSEEDVALKFDDLNPKAREVGMCRAITNFDNNYYLILYLVRDYYSSNYAEVVSAQTALNEIIKSDNLELLSLRKYKRLRELYESQTDPEDRQM